MLNIGLMTLPGSDARSFADRRLLLDRRAGVERRQETPGGQIVDRRLSAERRSTGDRRVGVERRLSIQSAEDQIRGAMKLLAQVAQTGALSDVERRELDAAMLRLRFAAERLVEGAG